MKLPNYFKIIWWVLLLGIVTYFLSQRYNSFINGSATSMDIFIFLIWISLLLVPLFQEVSFFGIKLKKEIDSLKSDVKEQIINLRSEIQSSIDVRTQINPQIYLTPPPPDSQLPIIEKRFRQILEETLSTQGIQRPIAESAEIEVPDSNQFLFSIRYQMENELRRIFKQRFGEEEGKRPLPIFHITRSLAESGLIDPRLAVVIREVYLICSPAIHGEQVSDSIVRFVRDIAPEIIVSLKAIQ